MSQITLRIPDDLAERVKQAATEHGRSVNAYCQAVLTAATDPEFAGDDVARIRERLSRAVLLAVPPAGGRARPPAKATRAARKAAGRGSSLAELVSEGR